MTTIATVVTYNRSTDLRACLAALEALDPPVDDILVINNASTDDTESVLADEFPHIAVHHSGENLGGAGGFALAVELALAQGHDHAWLMDDDAAPLPDSYGPLKDIVENARINPRPAFLASRVVTPDGDDLMSHRPPATADTESQMRASNFGCVSVAHCSFVGALINLNYAARTWLPVREFFIILDDLEYTSRLSTMGPGWFVPSSRIAHPDKKVSHKYDPRWWVGVRNTLWIARDKRLGSDLLRRKRLRRIVRPVVASALRSPDKSVYARQLKSVAGDVLRRPPTLRLPQSR